MSRSGWRLNERVDATLRRHPEIWVECEERPDGFVSIADLGCSMTAELDMRTGRMYIAAPCQSFDSYLIEQGREPTRGSEDKWTCAISYLRASLEDFVVNLIEQRLNPDQTASASTVTPRRLTREILDEDGQSVGDQAGDELPATSYRTLRPDEV